MHTLLPVFGVREPGTGFRAVVLGFAMVAGGCTPTNRNVGYLDEGGAGGSLAQGGTSTTGGSVTADGGRIDSGGSTATSGGSTATSGGSTATSGGSTANPPGSGGAAGTAGSGTGGCWCPAETVRWMRDGGFAFEPVVSAIDCNGYSRNTFAGSEDPIQPAKVPIDCAEWGTELQRVAAAFENLEVKRALTRSPVLYGVDARPVDGTVLSIRVGDASIEIGAPCSHDDDDDECTDTPAGVTELWTALSKLERRAAMQATPECLPQPVAMLPLCSQSGLYAWTGLFCQQVQGMSWGGLSCGVPQYYTEGDCSRAHGQCVGLYRECWGKDGLHRSGLDQAACDEDEYCAYLAGSAESQMCGAGDATAVCLPRPKSCKADEASVCACDGKLYPSACEAARAGFGVGSASQCSAGTCTTDVDCSGLSRQCNPLDPDTGPKPFCIDTACQCRCGRRDSSGEFVPGACPD